MPTWKRCWFSGHSTAWGVSDFSSRGLRHGITPHYFGLLCSRYGIAPVGLARHRACWADPLYGGDWSAFCDTALVLLEDWKVTHAK